MVQFPEPVGTLEAFHTAGGISIMPFTYEGKVDVMEYKTLRYPGHLAVMRPIRELGLLDLDPVDVRGQRVVPRELFIASVTPKLKKPDGKDLVALRVEAPAGSRTASRRRWSGSWWTTRTPRGTSAP
jgi:lysine 6-dehydrogenase